MNTVIPETGTLQQAIALYHAGRFQAVLDLAAQLPPDQPQAASLLNVAAVSARNLGLPDQAEALWRRAVALKPDYADAHRNLGDFLRKELGRPDEAETCYRQALALRPGDAEAHYHLGTLLHQRGQHAEAEASYRRALAAKPDHPDAGNNLGVLLQALGRYGEAEACYRRALELKPDKVGTHYNLGNLLCAETGRHGEAEASYRAALALSPGYAEARYALANVLYEQGRRVEAEANYRGAVELKPEYPDAHHNLGVLLLAEGRHAEAEARFREALAQRPDFSATHRCLGDSLRALGRPDGAEAEYRRALSLEPADAGAWRVLGALCHERERLAEAEACYRRALSINTDDIDALRGLGFLLYELKRCGEAEALFRRALRLDPGKPDIHNGWGVLLKELERPAEAEASYREALRLDPNYSDAHYNLGLLLASLKRYGEAEACYRQALARVPEFADARFSLGLLLLLLGRYEEGWSCIEARYHPGMKGRRITLPPSAYPRWEGQPLAGKSILVLLEQGYGDEIQFCRYAAALKARGADKVTLVCKAPLKGLLASLAEADAVLTREEAEGMPAHDYWALSMSLPLHMGTTLATIPAHLPYLKAAPERLAYWSDRLPTAPLRIGLVWKGAAIHQNDAHRSLPGLEALAPLWRVPGTAFASLQKGAGEDQAANPPEGQPLLDLGSHIRDFADTAAIVSSLDLVICVDTSIAHLAGALNKPCWVLLPMTGIDWRWGLERGDSPWYPGALRLFRQARRGDWGEVVERVARELARLGAGAEAPGALRDRASALYQRGCFQDALRLLDGVELSGVGDPSLLNMLAVCARRLGRFGRAEALLKRALAVKPDYANACNNLGLLYKESKRLEEAEALYRRALEFQPQEAETHANLGNLLYELGRYDGAEAHCRRAVALRPDSAVAHCNLGNVLRYARSRYDEAEASYRRALALAPGDADTRFSLGLLLLLRGRFEEGWRLCEARHQEGKSGERIALPNLPFPRWEGEPLHGKSIAIWLEQGFGDEIQFCRYAGTLKALGAARVTLVCKAPLKALLRSLDAADAVFTRDELGTLPPQDYWALSLSIPLHVGTDLGNIPAALPYLKAEPERVAHWASRLPSARLRVGLVWKGSATHKNDAHRSLPDLRALAPLWRVADAVFVGLQKGAGEDQAANPPEDQPVLDLGPAIQDFADTAAIVSSLDLVICVDTAIAHLAGALNKPCWVLLPAAGIDWRWLLERTDSPWYPGVLRLFRQMEIGDWASVVETVALALTRFAPETRADGGGLERLVGKLAGLSPAGLRAVEVLVDRLSEGMA